jgi:hypothetical protein
MRKSAAAVAVAVLTLGTAGCAGNHHDAHAAAAAKAHAEQSKAAASLSDKIISSQRSGSSSQLFSLTRKQADCIGTGFVHEIGTGRLQRYGVLDKSLKAKEGVDNVTMSPSDARSASGVFFDCADVTAMVRKIVASSGQIPQQLQACVDKALDDSTLRPVFTKVFEGRQQDAQKALVEPIMTCAPGSSGG